MLVARLETSKVSGRTIGPPQCTTGPSEQLAEEVWLSAVGDVRLEATADEEASLNDADADADVWLTAEAFWLKEKFVWRKTTTKTRKRRSEDMVVMLGKCLERSTNFGTSRDCTNQIPYVQSISFKR